MTDYSKMSDYDISYAMTCLIDPDCNGGIIDYCRDWSATGPLMVKYGIQLKYWSDGGFQASQHFLLPFSSNNPNPLRAICEVILQTAGEK